MFAYRVLPKLPSLLHGLVLMLGTAFVPSLLKVCGFCDNFKKFNSENRNDKLFELHTSCHLKCILETDYGILFLPIPVKNFLKSI